MTRKITYSGMIIAIYVALTVILGAISYGPIQVRFAAGLYVLAALDIWFTLPLAIATGMANYFGGLGAPDIIIGPIASTAACLGCYAFRKHKWLIPAAIPLFSAPILAGYLHLLFGLPFWFMLATIFIGQSIAGYTLGAVVLNVFYNRGMFGQDGSVLPEGRLGENVYRENP